jgi:hypothetical protein
MSGISIICISGKMFDIVHGLLYLSYFTLFIFTPCWPAFTGGYDCDLLIQSRTLQVDIKGVSVMPILSSDWVYATEQE